MAEEFIWVRTISDADGTAEGEKGLEGAIFGNFESQSSLGRYPVPTSKIEAGMTDLLQKLGHVLGRVQQDAGELAGMELDEISLSVEITAQGQVSLLGIGAQSGGKGAVSLKFKRVQ